MCQGVTARLWTSNATQSSCFRFPSLSFLFPIDHQTQRMCRMLMTRCDLGGLCIVSRIRVSLLLVLLGVSLDIDRFPIRFGHQRLPFPSLFPSFNSLLPLSPHTLRPYVSCELQCSFPPTVVCVIFVVVILMSPFPLAINERQFVSCRRLVRTCSTISTPLLSAVKV